MAPELLCNGLLRQKYESSRVSAIHLHLYTIIQVAEKKRLSSEPDISNLLGIPKIISAARTPCGFKKLMELALRQLRSSNVSLPDNGKV